MSTITYDAQSFMLDGKRIWIVAGETHYFRLPKAEWKDALLRAKRAGLNAVSTYVPWNYHEPFEGAYDFEGDRDLAHYIDLAASLGLHVMVRPGPYICSEWDGGGIPAWLCAKGVRRFREDDPVYMTYVTRWFEKLLPLIASRQATRGGPVITVQNENEYPGGWDASMRRYIEKLGALFRLHGIDVPIVACNVHGNTETTCKINDATKREDQIVTPEIILTYNHHVVVEPLRDLKRIQPDVPSIVTEFWNGPPVNWGDVPRVRENAWPSLSSQGRAAYEFTSIGAQLCYYMFEGGTNFAFWAGCNIASSYASSYAVGDGGTLKDKYYGLKPSIQLCSQFGDFLAESREAEDCAGLSASEGVRLAVRQASSGGMAFLSAQEPRSHVRLSLPDGHTLTVHWGEIQAAVLPYRLAVMEGRVLEYSNLCILGQARGAVLLYGQAGTEGVLCVNGQEARVPVRRHGVAQVALQGITLLIADEYMARRCWTLESGRVVFGPDFVGEERNQAADARIGTDTAGVYVWDGVALSQTYPATPEASRAAKQSPPALLGWQMRACGEVPSAQSDAQDGDWKPLQGPVSHEALGVPYGYVWYKAQVWADSAGDRRLLLTNTPNRVSVFVNGRFCGVHAERRRVRMRDEYAHPADWAFEELSVTLQSGMNDFVFLSDNQGHNYDVPIPLGIQGPVYAGSRMITPLRLCKTPPHPVSREGFHFLYNRWYRQAEPLLGAAFELDVAPGEDAYLVVHGVQAWVSVDGQDVLPMSYPESPWTMFPQIKRWITWRLPAGAKTVCVQQVGETHDVMEHLAAYAVRRDSALQNWRWKPWTMPQSFANTGTGLLDSAGGTDSLAILLPVGSYVACKGKILRPAWFQARFAMPAGDRPVYFDIGEMQKGQLYLNGQNVGRFWKQGGTQTQYYLPRTWMRPDNRLEVFEELGLYPQKACLVWGGKALAETGV